MSSIRAPLGGFSTGTWSSAATKFALRGIMSKLSFLLISATVLFQGPDVAQAAPPSRMEIAYELSRNGAALADIDERLEHGDGKYQLVETWKGRGLYALLGTAKRSSRGSVAAD